MIVELCGRALRVENPTQEGEARWRGLMSPEPETCAWIDGLPADDTFIDVGANVGTFTARAALRGLEVFAFEPEAERFAQLCRLITENRLKDTVAYPFAVGARPYQIGCLVSGRSSHTFSWTTPTSGQGTISVSLDEFFLDDMPVGSHVKIDVDGNEPEVIEGGRETLGHAASVMVEIDPGAPGHDRIIPMMRELGFDFDPAQVAACVVKAHEYGGKYTGLANHLFRKVK